MPNFIIKTFGCKTNQYESEGIREALTSKGWNETEIATDSTIGIINTCSVTSRAGASARNAINKLIKKNPNIRIILTGCAVDIDEEWLKQLNIEAAFKNTQKHLICDYLCDTELIGKSSGDGFEFSLNDFKGHTRAFLKVQDGCDNYCSYCIIPYARGNPRSRPLNEILTEARQLSENGYKELVLTGINIGAYNNNKALLSDLLSELAKIPEITRIRLGSIEPIYLSDQLLYTIRDNAKICAHLHLPLQSGSNAVLTTMNRKYTKEDFLECVARSREILDNPAITTDIIVGFPTEDENNFNETLQTINAVGFARSHIFLFSPRDGTPAAKMKRPPQREADKRRKILEEITAAQAIDYSKSLVGFSAEQIMIEKVNESKAYGYLERYIRAELEFSDDTDIIRSKTYSVDIKNLKTQTKQRTPDIENTVICHLK